MLNVLMTGQAFSSIGGPHAGRNRAKARCSRSLCQRYGAARLEVFGSAARGAGFYPDRSDADFLVTFTPAARNDLPAFADLKDSMEKLLGRPVDLVEREVIEDSRNFIRRRAILRDAELVYG